MSFVVATPELVAAAATELAGIESMIGAANAAAMAPTTSVMAAAADEVSMAIAALFGAHGEAYQAVSAQGAAFHAQFVAGLDRAGSAYAGAEALNASAQSIEQDVLAVINAPTGLLLGALVTGAAPHSVAACSALLTRSRIGPTSASS
ncbi:PE domain-containing protein [Mycobacterium spongiae]|uniref:PE domain-containing protein n=1 Tax=Mycobacterium spongiae TaxID=886343 RepID=A0A975JY52_9MYCO|nr:PE domain-containing protein [Mycobacterium spongiae]